MTSETALRVPVRLADEGGIFSELWRGKAAPGTSVLPFLAAGLWHEPGNEWSEPRRTTYIAVGDGSGMNKNVVGGVLDHLSALGLAEIERDPKEGTTYRLSRRLYPGGREPFFLFPRAALGSWAELGRTGGWALQHLTLVLRCVDPVQNPAAYEAKIRESMPWDDGPGGEADELAREKVAGRRDSSIPPLPELCRRTGMSRATVRRTLADFRAERTERFPFGPLSAPSDLFTTGMGGAHNRDTHARRNLLQKVSWVVLEFL